MHDIDSLRAWVGEYHLGQLAEDGLSLTPVTGDAGFRAYFRTNTQPPFIAAHAPSEYEDNLAFVTKGLALSKGGIHVPAIYAVDYQCGFLLQEDLGDRLYLGELSVDTQGSLYDRAEAVLLKIQGLPDDTTIFPVYGEALLRREMDLFPQWFVGSLLGVELDSRVQQLVDPLFEALIGSAVEQAQVVVHRDYHSRNLLKLADGDVGVIDFQDAVMGPVTYDLASLLRDCYVRWSPSLVEERVENYRRKLLMAADEGKIAVNVPDADTFLRWFDLMGLQRHLKVLGIFARLSLRDGKARYLNDLPLVVRYVLEVAQKYPETEELYRWFVACLVPQMAAHDWYKPWQSAGEPL